jgi:hypothetical protein
VWPTPQRDSRPQTRGCDGATPGRACRAAGGRGGTGVRFALAATEAGSGGGPDLRGGGADGVGRGGVLGAFFQTGALGAGRAGAGTPGTVIALGADGGAESTTVRSLSTANGSGFRAITSVGSSVSIESAALFAEPTVLASVVPHLSTMCADRARSRNYLKQWWNTPLDRGAGQPGGGGLDPGTRVNCSAHGRAPPAARVAPRPPFPSTSPPRCPS